MKRLVHLGLGLSLTALAACSPTPPTIGLEVTKGPGAPDVVGLDRLQLTVQPCGDATPLVDTDLDVRADAIAPLTLDLVPGTELYVHLRGWLACAGQACTPPAQAGPDDCVCPEVSGDPARILRAEGCSDWFVAEQDRQVTISLGTQLGLCPPPVTECTP